jgi:hypothetical protein
MHSYYAFLRGQEFIQKDKEFVVKEFVHGPITGGDEFVRRMNSFKEE